MSLASIDAAAGQLRLDGMAGLFGEPAPARRSRRVAAGPRRLQPGYYRDNFATLLADVERDHGDLLNASERLFAVEFNALSVNAQRLYVRLLTRRGPWFRLDRLRYAEIACAPAARELVEEGFAALAASADIVSLDATLAAELAATVPALRLLRLAEVETFRLLFFGNLRQGLSEFVLAELGIVRFEPVQLEAGGRWFPSREVVEQHRALHRLAEAARQRPPAGEPSAALELARRAHALASAETAWHPSTLRLRDSLFNYCARILERLGQFEPALELYVAAQAPPARERRVRILRRLENDHAAAELQREIAAAPRDESERVFGERGVRGRRRPPALPRRELEVEDTRAVEDAALAALARQGSRGFFAENWLWRALCGLALWDLLFAPLPGAFTHRFQRAPHDFKNGFRAAREALVAARLGELAADPAPGPALLALWDAKRGIANPLVAFAPDLRPRLELARSVLGGRTIAAVADRLSRDFRRYGAGFPDLFLIDRHGAAWLAEIKGPGDVLRPEQEGWIEFFNGIGLPAVVVQARATG